MTMMCKDRLRAYLEEHDVPYQVKQHRRAFSAQEVAESEHIPGSMVAKVVAVLADENMVLLTLPATTYLQFDKVEAALGGKHVRMATEAELAAAFPDCEPGTMPPFGNLYEMPVCADASLTAHSVIVFPTGTSTETMSVRYADFARLVSPLVANVITGS